MLTIEVPALEEYNEETEEFYSIKKPVTLNLEHSLVSISKWESKWEKSFIDVGPKNEVEQRDYIRCMTINAGIDPLVYELMPASLIQKIFDYINARMTATTITKTKTGKGSNAGEGITSELIYYWMIAANIPMECQKWHLNRLLTLIEICSVKSNPPQKISPRDLASRNAALNAARRKRLGTKG